MSYAATYLTTPAMEERIFAALRKKTPNPRAREARKNAWILEATWRLVNTRVSTHQYLAQDQYLICCLVRGINAILKADLRWRTEEAGGELDNLLTADPPLHKEACHHMKGWYKAEFDCAPPATQVTLEWITADHVVLYHQVQPPGENIPLSSEMFSMEDSVNMEDKIELAVRG